MKNLYYYLTTLTGEPEFDSNWLKPKAKKLFDNAIAARMLLLLPAFEAGH